MTLSLSGLVEIVGAAGDGTVVGCAVRFEASELSGELVDALG